MTTEIDVVMLTKNSDRWLSQCLTSIFENVPVNRLIVVDGHSTDKTLEILAKFDKVYGKIKIIKQNGSRGLARTRGIQEVVTEWFLFVDSDVVLCDGWFEKAKRYLQSDVGAVWGVDIPGDMANKLLVFLFKWIETRVFKIRGGCHDLLIRYDCVRDIEIPSRLHTLEDAFIKEWISAKNYKVIVSFSPFCRHYKTMNSLFSKESVHDAFLELKNMKLVRERLLFAGVFAFGWLLHEAGFNGKKSVKAKKPCSASYV